MVTPTTFSQAGISLGLARILLADPATFHDRLGILRRGVLSITHPDTTSTADQDVATISLAFNELLALEAIDLKRLLDEIDQPTVGGDQIAQAELKLQIQDLKELNRGLQNQLQTIGNEFRAVLNRKLEQALRVSIAAVHRMLWGSPLKIHQNVLIEEKNVVWARHTEKPKSRIKSLEYGLKLVTPNNTLVRFDDELKLTVPGPDKDGDRSSFIGAPIHEYRQAIEDKARELLQNSSHLEIDPLKNGLLIGFIPANSETVPIVRRMIKRQGGRKTYLSEETLSDLRGKDTKSVEAIDASYVRTYGTCEQPLEDSYFLVVWKLDGNGDGLMAIEEHRVPKTIIVNL